MVRWSRVVVEHVGPRGEERGERDEGGLKGRKGGKETGRESESLASEESVDYGGDCSWRGELPLSAHLSRSDRLNMHARPHTHTMLREENCKN